MIDTVRHTDIAKWRELAREVEPLFGPMISDAGFLQAMETVIREQRAYCLREEDGTFGGIIVLNRGTNEIEWFAVNAAKRRKGYGNALLHFALANLDAKRPIIVQTFADTVPEGREARKLYTQMGFYDVKEAGFNPAGLPTVIMERDRGCQD